MRHPESDKVVTMSIKYTILGSGDTLGTPIAGCTKPACLDPGSKRYRFGLLFEIGDTKILIDPNPDIKWQCIDNDFELKDIDHILVTHQHSDHINGLGEFFFRRDIPTQLWYGKHPLNEKLIDYWRYLEREEVMEFKTYEAGKSFMLTDEIEVLPITLSHGFPTCGFVLRVGKKSVAIVTDTNPSLPKETLMALNSVDVLFCDTFSEDMEQITGVYDDCGIDVPDLSREWFHMTLPQVRALQKQVRADKVYTVHMSRHIRPHAELVNAYETRNFIIGYDGLCGAV